MDHPDGRPKPVICELDPEHLKYVESLKHIADLANDAVSEAQDLKLGSRHEPVQPYKPGQVHVCVTGATNSGKSSLLNALLYDYSNASLCPTNITAETAKCTTFRFGPEGTFKLNDKVYDSFDECCRNLARIQERPKGGHCQQDARDIVVELPLSLARHFKIRQELAWMVDTPGITEAEDMKRAVLQRIRPKGRDLTVLVHCVSLKSGINPDPRTGQELSWVDRLIVDLVPEHHRVVLVATHYDLFVEGQKVKPTQASTTPNLSREHASQADDEQQRRKARQTFDAWAQSLRRQCQGISVLPFVRLVKKAESEENLEMAKDIREAVARAVQLAHKDMAWAHRDALSMDLLDRIRDIAGFPGKLSQEEQLVVREATAAGIKVLNKSADMVKEILEREAGILSKATYCRYDVFRNDLLQAATHIILTELRSCRDRAAAEASRIVTAKLGRPSIGVISFSASRAPQQREASAAAGIVSAAAGVLGGAVGGSVAAESVVVGVATRFIAGAMIGTAATALLFLGVGLAIHASAWSTDDVVKELHAEFVKDITEPSRFKKHLEDITNKLVTEVVTSVTQESNVSAQKLFDLQRCLADPDLVIPTATSA